ncbi:MAG: MFS transporter [Zoogloeaceae bacterium]|nr:MFS transporter [Zoogloeaceae bacterium]
MNPALRPGAWATLFLPFALGYYLSYLLRTVNAVISPDLTAELALSASDLGLLTSAYFITFGLAQIPLGIALDRFGPRRINAALLLVAAFGAIVFALGESMLELSLGRGLIGLGVSACLMAGLKAFSMWYPPERQSSMTGFIMAAGALGALTAATPVEALLPAIGWRGVFWILAVVAVFAAVHVWRCIPDTPAAGDARSLPEALGSLGSIFRSRDFLRFAGTAMFFTGGFMALQSLWAVPWLMNVEALSRSEAAGYLVLLNLGMFCGQISIGFFGTRLARRGVRPINLLQVGYCCVLGVELAIVTGVLPSAPLWFLLGLLAAVNAQAYVAAASCFPREAFGRVSTAINLMAFAGAFVVQWGMGIVLDALGAAGHAGTVALTSAFVMLIVVQSLVIVPLFWRTKSA